MAKPVKCLYCGETFDREKEEAILVTARRYAHKKCCEQLNVTKTQADLDYEELINYIKVMLKDSYIDIKVKKQIMEFKKEYNYTFSGMLKTLQWWYDIKQNPIDKANGGIGIIPFVYDEAYKYFKKLYEAENAAAGLQYHQTRVEEIVIPPPSVVNRPPRLFNIEGEE